MHSLSLVIIILESSQNGLPIVMPHASDTEVLSPAKNAQVELSSAAKEFFHATSEAVGSDLLSTFSAGKCE